MTQRRSGTGVADRPNPASRSELHCSLRTFKIVRCRLRRVGQAVDQAAKAVAAKRPPNTDNMTALPKAKLQVLSGAFAGRELELTKALTTLGRPGIQVAAITRRSEGYFIVHVDSGKENDFPLVNGLAIGPQARRLNDNDVVQLAGVKMGFFES